MKLHLDTKQNDDYKHLYHKYKIKYLTTKYNVIGGENKNLENIVFIVGYGGAGKTHLSKKLAKYGYYVVSCDLIIEKYIMKDPLDCKHYGIYEGNIDASLVESKNKFIAIIKKILQEHKKVVIEGQIKSIDIFNEIVGKQPFSIILVKPKNINSYINNITNRFIEDPANYGLIGRLQYEDTLNNKIGLNDYIKNGINGKYIQKLIKHVATKYFARHQQTHDYYKKKFKNLIVELT